MIGQVNFFLSMNFMQNYLDKNNPSKLQKKNRDCIMLLSIAMHALGIIKKAIYNISYQVGT